MKTINNTILYKIQIWFNHEDPNKEGMIDRFVVEAESDEDIIELARARVDKYKQNFHTPAKVYELCHIHIMEFEPNTLSKDGSMQRNDGRFVWVGK
jgi:hypothetical protein